MRNDHYTPNTVLALISTELVTPNSRKALQARIDRQPVTEPKFFSAETFVTLQSVCARLIPQQKDRLIDLAGCLDELLHEGKGNGWRYNTMPDDGTAIKVGLYGINKSAVSVFDKDFHLLNAKEQDEILMSVQSATANGLTWEIIPANLFFEELLAALVEIYYSHPFAKEDIGEVAMADAKGWKKIGLNELEAHEPKPIK